MKNISPQKLSKYQNKWVALDTHNNNKVIASADHVKKVDKILEKMDNDQAVITKILPFDVTLVPCVIHF